MNYNSQRWVSLLACILASMCGGLAYSWSVFLKPLISVFNWSEVYTSLTFTLLMSTAGVMAIFAGKALDYLQPKQVIFLGGTLFGLGLFVIGFINTLAQMYLCVIIAGIGLGMVYPGGTVSNMLRFFPDKMGLVSGLVSAGYGMGPVIWAPLSVTLIAQYGVMVTLKILGIAIFILIGILSVFIETAPDGYRPKGWIPSAKIAQASACTVEKNWKQMLVHPLFYPLAITFTLGGITGMMIIGHASTIAQEMINMTPAGAAAIVSLLSIAITLGKLGWGWVSDKIGRYPVVILLLILGGAGMGLLAMTGRYIFVVAVFVVVGLCYGGFLAIMAPLTADLFGTKNLPINFGIMFLTVALAAYIGPLLAAVAKEANNGDYTQAFIIAAVLNLVGIIIFGFFSFYRKRKVCV